MKHGRNQPDPISASPWDLRPRLRSLLLVCISLYGLLVSTLAYLGDGVIPLTRPNSEPIGTRDGVQVYVYGQPTQPTAPTVRPLSLVRRTPKRLICLVPTTSAPRKLRKISEWALDSTFRLQTLDTITCWEAEND